MTFNYSYDDLLSLKNQVRAIAPDNRPDAATGKYRFADEEIELFLSLEGGAVKGAAALLLETRATDTADSEGYVKTYALELDGTKAASVLLKRAALFRDQIGVVVEVEDDLLDFLPGF